MAGSTPYLRLSSPIMAVRSLVLGLLVCVVTSACEGSSHSPSPSSSSVTPLRPLTVCPTTVHVPDEVSDVTPSASLPPTSVLVPGAGVAFSAPAGSTVGFSGPAAASEAAIVCLAPQIAQQRGRVVIVAQHPGYVRVGWRAGAADEARLTLIKVTS